MDATRDGVAACLMLYLIPPDTSMYLTVPKCCSADARL